MELPFNPLASTEFAKNITAACEVFEGMTRRYGKPEFGIKETAIHGLTVPVREEVVLKKTFCNLLHFDRDEGVVGKRYDPKVLLIAPMSGHYATLLRGTVQSMIKEHNLYITDWADARDVPLFEGAFGLDDFIDYIIEFIQFLGPNTHVMAVLPAGGARPRRRSRHGRRTTIPASPLADDDGRPDRYAAQPHAGQQTRRGEAPLLVREQRHQLRAVSERGLRPARLSGIHPAHGFHDHEPRAPYAGAREAVREPRQRRLRPVKSHRDFYEEYLAVMDLPAEFYLETVKSVFQEHLLPKGELMHRGKKVDCSAIRKTAIMTVEGERDDICGLGQTEAAHDLCSNVPVDEHYYYVQPGVGHYGVFSGTRFRTEIQPRIREMIRTVQFKRRLEAPDVKIPLPYRADGLSREAVRLAWRGQAFDRSQRRRLNPGPGSFERRRRRER